MAPRDTRSPSPAGSHHSSRRSYRDDVRYNDKDRRDDRGHRRRDRSRSPDVRNTTRTTLGANTYQVYEQRRRYDRDDRRHGDRAVDDRRPQRRNDDRHRTSHTDPDRDRRRSRDRAPRDRRDRPRDKDYRDRRDDSRDRGQRRRDRTLSPRPSPRREDRDRHMSKTNWAKGGLVSYLQVDIDENRLTVQPAAGPTSNEPSKEEKLAAKRAKLEEWKAKQEAKRQQQLEQSSVSNLLKDMDAKAASASPTAASSPQSPVTASDPASPAPYAGKFDPKAIAKKAASNSAAKNALGGDVALPLGAVGATGLASAKASYAKPTNGVSTAALARPLKASGNLSGFGLGSKGGADIEKEVKKSALDFEEEEAGRRKLQRLPDASLEAENAGADDQADDGDEDVEDDDIEMVGGTEEEQAAAAARVAEKREERLRQEQLAAKETGLQNDVNRDATMTEAPEEVNGAEAEEEEDVDPLDAFMAGVVETSANGFKNPAKKSGKQTEPEAFLDNDDADMDAVEGADDLTAAIAAKRKNRKDVPTVDHSKVQYEPFRKNFYTEPTELADMSDDDVNALRFELDGIKVRGINVPRPVQKWAQLGFSHAILDVIRNLGFEKLTPVQSQAIPTIMLGRDVISVARTGSGKTLGYLLPMLRHIADQRPLGKLESGPIALILTPTRELSTQVFRECKPFLKPLGLNAVCAYGGSPIKENIAEIKRTCHVLVATPGRLIDLMAANQGRVLNLRRVTYLVMDEADRMLDMGFTPQIDKIVASIRPDRQTALFSATFPPKMEDLARKKLVKPVEIIVGGRSSVPAEITQIVEVRPEESKFHRMLELLGELYDRDEDARTLVFVERQEGADNLLKEVMRKGYPCMSIHGGKDQIDRDSTISDFKAGVVPILIATSVAARGLDVQQLKLVINYDTPNHLEDYVHRAGRTGRAGNTGTAVTFLTPDQGRYAPDIAKALRQSNQPIPEPLQQLVDSFMENVKAGKEKAAGAGFGGRGIDRLDSMRKAERDRERKSYKTGEDPEEEDDKDKDKAKEEDIIVKPLNAPAEPPKPTSTLPKGMENLDPNSIVVHKTEKQESDSKSGSANPMDRVKNAVAAIGDRLGKRNQLHSGQPIDNKGPDAGAFHATLEINDYPQKARWAVTNRVSLRSPWSSIDTNMITNMITDKRRKDPRIHWYFYHDQGQLLCGRQRSRPERCAEAIYPCGG